MLIAENRLAAYSGARQRQQDAYNAETFAHWGRVALAVARKNGRRIGLDTGNLRMTGQSVSRIEIGAGENGLGERVHARFSSPCSTAAM